MLQFDHQSDAILYKGKKVGTYGGNGNGTTVRFDALEITLPSDAAITFVSQIAHLLADLEPPPEPVVLSIQSPTSAVTLLNGVLRTLTEKELKAGGYVWKFHKADADTWPSLLHGHEYEHGFKIDALTGTIFDANTRNPVGALNPKELRKLRAEIWRCKDLKNTAEKVALPGKPKEKIETPRHETGTKPKKPRGASAPRRASP